MYMTTHFVQMQQSLWSADSHNSQVSNIESDNSQNVGLEDYSNISDGIFPHFTTPSLQIYTFFLHWKGNEM